MKISIEKKYIRLGIVAFLVLCGSILFFFSIKRITGLLKAIEVIGNIFAPFVYSLA